MWGMGSEAVGKVPALSCVLTMSSHFLVKSLSHDLKSFSHQVVVTSSQVIFTFLKYRAGVGAISLYFEAYQTETKRAKIGIWSASEVEWDHLLASCLA